MIISKMYMYRYYEYKSYPQWDSGCWSTYEDEAMIFDIKNMVFEVQASVVVLH